MKIFINLIFHKLCENVIHNPHILHFSFYNILGLPKIIIAGKERSYFDYFYHTISAHPDKISDDVCKTYIKAYSTHVALNPGFN